jgi:hypothetical protein
MMQEFILRPGDVNRAAVLDANLLKFSAEIKVLPGIKSATARSVLVEQIVESLRRIEFVHLVRDGKIDARRADPQSELFDPIRAAAFWMRKGNFDEAFWLVFLATHFGKHAKHGWALTRAIYGGPNGQPWTWVVVSKNVAALRAWLASQEHALRAKFAFSNLRDICESGAIAKKKLGPNVADALKRRLSDFQSIASFDELPFAKPKKRSKNVKFDLPDNWELVVTSGHSDNPTLPSGKIDWSQVTRLKIVRIEKRK